MSRLSTLTISTVAALSASSALALAAAPQASDLFLGKISGGAGVQYELSATPKSQVVTINGKKAKVRHNKETGPRDYAAFVNAPGFKAGRSYTVTIKVTGRDGSTRTQRERLYLHRSQNRPR
jgi:hypothetical protein